MSFNQINDLIWMSDGNDTSSAGTLAGAGTTQRQSHPVASRSTSAQTQTRWARELEAEADRSGWVADTRLAKKTTLGELLARYRDQVSPTKRSAHTEKSRINAMVRRSITHRTLAKLTSADIATYRDERLKDVVPATVVRELNTITGVAQPSLHHSEPNQRLPLCFRQKTSPNHQPRRIDVRNPVKHFSGSHRVTE